MAETKKTVKVTIKKSAAAKPAAAKTTATKPAAAKPAVAKKPTAVKTDYKRKILFVASEATPFIQTGGLAEVIGSLSCALAKTGKFDVRVVIPLYSDIKKEYRDKFTYLPEDELLGEANKWELSHGGLSGRTAQQFIDYLSGLK